MKRTTRLALRGAAAGAIGLAALTAGTGAALIAGTGTAQAGPYTAPTTEWCPGQALPFQEIRWDMSRCHVWFGVPFGQGNVSMVYPDGTAADSFISADVPPPELTPSRPQPLPPGQEGRAVRLVGGEFHRVVVGAQGLRERRLERSDLKDAMLGAGCHGMRCLLVAARVASRDPSST